VPLRPRLAFLVNLLGDLVATARGRRAVGDLVATARGPRAPPTAGSQSPRGQVPAGEDQRSAEELRRRLDETRERLKREIPPEPE
jgi:hypothetical protein